MAVKSTLVASTPGNMNVRSEMPPVDARVSDCSPVPSTNRNSTGCTSAATMRILSCAKRISSRCQTTLTARASLRRPGGATRTARDREREPAHPRPRAKTRMPSVADASASRIVVPV